MHLFSFLDIYLFLLKKKGGGEAYFPAPNVHWVWRGGARASPLVEGVGVEGNGIGSVVHGEKVPDVPGPKAGPTQGRGMLQLQQGEAGEGVLGLDLSALGQRQKEP